MLLHLQVAVQHTDTYIRNNNNKCYTFLECIRDGFLDQYVKESTRKQAILDWVLCNERGFISNLEVRDPLGKSDHNMVKCFIKMENETVKSETRVLKLRKANFDGMRRALARISW